MALRIVYDQYAVGTQPTLRLFKAVSLRGRHDCSRSFKKVFQKICDRFPTNKGTRKSLERNRQDPRKVAGRSQLHEAIVGQRRWKYCKTLAAEEDPKNKTSQDVSQANTFFRSGERHGRSKKYPLCSKGLEQRRYIKEELTGFKAQEFKGVGTVAG